MDNSPFHGLLIQCFINVVGLFLFYFLSLPFPVHGVRVIFTSWDFPFKLENKGNKRMTKLFLEIQ